MIKNIYKIVLRNMWRYKGYTVLNIFGMGIGLAAIVWGFQTYRFSFSFGFVFTSQQPVDLFYAFTIISGVGRIIRHYCITEMFQLSFFQSLQHGFDNIFFYLWSLQPRTDRVLSIRKHFIRN